VSPSRGHATTCLDRHVAAARATAADVVVKIPSDCPLIDPATIDRVIAHSSPNPTSTTCQPAPPTWPDGF
jgi:spore coat polysaccharide biosynthesis protein SpsF